MQDAHTDRGGGVLQTDREKATLVIEDDGEVAGHTRVTLFGDGLIEDPGVPLPQRTLCRRVDAHGNSFCSGVRELQEDSVKVHRERDYTVGSKNNASSVMRCDGRGVAVPWCVLSTRIVNEFKIRDKVVVEIISDDAKRVFAFSRVTCIK